MSSGVLLIDKPTGMSSAQVVGAVKRRLDVRRVGHAGTLDPMATGLLVVLVGEATRFARFAEARDKVYTGAIRFGLRTSTDDRWGETLGSNNELPTYQAACAAATKFVGAIEQVPPQVSAVHVDGERAYKRVRRGETVEIKPRQVTVNRFELTPPSDLGAPVAEISFVVECSKGTYIRSLARDLGQALGCGACLSELRREASAPFRVDQAQQLEDLPPARLMPWWVLLPDAPRVAVPEDVACRLQGGDSRVLETFGRIYEARYSGVATGSYAVYQNESSGAVGGLLHFDGQCWRYEVNLPIVDSEDGKTEDLTCHP